MTETANIPRSIGMILDGNRRYAREKGLPSLEGHRLGYEKLKEVARWCKEKGVEYLIVYAFSTENWNRAPEEVGYLTELIKTILTEGTRELQKEHMRVRFIGQLERFGKEIAESARKTETETKDNDELTVVIALSYGGRAEILKAAQELLKNPPEGELTEEVFEKHLWTAGIPDPDIILRTGGEQRLSGFLSWQGVYSELFFVPTYWPAFSKEEFEQILEEYGKRQRRHGK